jgi:hypothetical protein
VVTGLLLFASGGVGTIYMQARAQEGIVSYLRTRLARDHVPVTSIVVTSESPLGVQVTVQSLSRGAQGTPSDPIYYHLVEREILLASQAGFAIEDYTILFDNQQSQQISRSELHAKPDLAWAIDNSPSRVPDSDTRGLLRAGLDLHGFALTRLTVDSEGGLQRATLWLAAATLDDANRNLGPFLLDLQALLTELNRSGSHVVLCGVEVRDAHGGMLLNYLLDLQLASQTWWMADGIDKDWFPHP